LKDLFNHIEQGRRLKKEDQQKGKIPFVMSGTTNQGMIGYIANPVASFPANSITVDIFGNTFYRDYAFGAGDDTGVYWNDNIQYSRRAMLFIAALIGKSLEGKYSYGHKLRSSQSHNFIISLPQTIDKKINFAFMENFVRELEESRLHGLETYLFVTGLNNYELTDNDVNALKHFKKLHWQEFRIEDLFERAKTAKLKYSAKALPKQPTDKNTLPCLTSSFMNQGLNYYAPREGATILNNVISIPSNSDVYRAYYQSDDFTVLSDAYAIRWKNKSVSILPNQYLFMVACINKVTNLPIYSYKNKLGGWNVVKNKHIVLPVDEDNQPDLVAMEKLITAMQKVAIADVARFTAQRLDATRQVISRESRSNSLQDSIQGAIAKKKAETIHIYDNYHEGRVPLFTLRAACGKFRGEGLWEEEGWVDASGNGFTPNAERYFAVYAKGNSMYPDIKDGDICVFEWYNQVGGTREGDILLVECDGIDDECTIKKYHSVKKYFEDGTWEHERIELIPLNREYDTIVLEADSKYRPIGVLKCVL
jgi:SOS-response transcriptional repressor LexA